MVNNRTIVTLDKSFIFLSCVTKRYNLALAHKFGDKQARCVTHCPLCPWSCSFGWCLAEGQRIRVISADYACLITTQQFSLSELFPISVLPLTDNSNKRLSLQPMSSFCLLSLSCLVVKVYWVVCFCVIWFCLLTWYLSCLTRKMHAHLVIFSLGETGNMEWWSTKTRLKSHLLYLFIVCIPLL